MKKSDSDTEKKRKREYASNRPDYAKWYTKPRWKKLREKHLRFNPVCERCRATATEVDHVVDHKGRYGLFYDPSNLQSLCKSCHSRKTAITGGFAKGGKDKMVGR